MRAGSAPVPESRPHIHRHRARLLMIIRNGSKTTLLAEENTADQRRVTARDHRDPTRPPCRIRILMRTVWGGCALSAQFRDSCAIASSSGYGPWHGCSRFRHRCRETWRGDGVDPVRRRVRARGPVHGSAVSGFHRIGSVAAVPVCPWSGSLLGELRVGDDGRPCAA